MSIALGIPTPNEPVLATLERDEEGFLLDANDWHPDLIEVLADEHGLVMTPERREVVDCIRNYSNNYSKKNLSVPEARVLLKHLQAVWDKSRATRRYLYQLLPRGYGQQVARSPACANHAS